MRYIEGKNLSPTTKNYSELGAITAKLNNLKGFPFKTEFDSDIVISHLIKKSKELNMKTDAISGLLEEEKIFSGSVRSKSWSSEHSPAYHNIYIYVFS